jgi:putative spermidine/putrescine transport system permease protein
MRSGWRLRQGDLPLAALIIVLAALAMLILIGPVVIVVLTSFSTSTALRFPPPGLTLRWYGELFDPARSAIVWRAAANSAVVAFGASLLATVLATAAALGVARNPARWARFADAGFMLPLVLPGIAFGLAALMFASWLGLTPSLPVLVAAHGIVVTPYVFRSAVAAAAGLEPAWLDASASLGASAWMTFRRVILPAIRSGVLAGAFLAFVASLDNVPVSLFLGSARTDMLPIRMWGMMENALDVRVAAISGLLVGFSFMVLLLMDRFVGLTRRIGNGA